MSREKIVFGTLLIIGVSLAAGLAQARITLPTPPAAKRAYLCIEGRSAASITKKANEAGARGWKMVAAAPGDTGSVWCFEQLSAGRPAPR